MNMIADAIDGFTSWLADQDSGAYDGLELAFIGWLQDFESSACGLYVVGGDYTLFLQVAFSMRDRLACGEEKDVAAALGGDGRESCISRDSVLLDERWFKRALLAYQTRSRTVIE